MSNNWCSVCTLEEEPRQSNTCSRMSPFLQLRYQHVFTLHWLNLGTQFFYTIFTDVYVSGSVSWWRCKDGITKRSGSQTSSSNHDCEYIMMCLSRSAQGESWTLAAFNLTVCSLIVNICCIIPLNAHAKSGIVSYYQRLNNNTSSVWA